MFFFPPENKNTVQSLLVGAFVLSGIAFPLERWIMVNWYEERDLI
jgi:hypothetical protein